jgi:hypothetical protein
MKTVPAWVRGAFLVAVVLGIVVPCASAAGGKGGGGKSGGGGHSSAPRATFHAQPAPRMAAPQVSAQPRQQAAAGQYAARAARAAQARQATNSARSAQARVGANAARSARARQSANTALSTTSAVGGSSSINRAGVGRSSAYRYRPRTTAYRGYSYGNRYATGNRNMQAIVARLRTTQRSLAQVNHDYQGHRVRAMSAIGTAIRQLTNRSSSTVAFNNTMNGLGANNVNGLGANNVNGLGANNGNGQRGRNGAGLGGGVNGGQMQPQAQSDARMRRALSTLRGVHTQLTRQGYSANHARARTSVQHAMRELNTGLTVR